MIIWGIAFIDSRSEDWDFKSQLPRSGIRKKTVSDSFIVKEFWKDEKKSLAKINDGQRILRGFQQDIMKLNCLWRNVRVKKRLLWRRKNQMFEYSSTIEKDSSNVKCFQTKRGDCAFGTFGVSTFPVWPNNFIWEYSPGVSLYSDWIERKYKLLMIKWRILWT